MLPNLEVRLLVIYSVKFNEIVRNRMTLHPILAKHVHF